MIPCCLCTCSRPARKITKRANVSQVYSNIYMLLSFRLSSSFNFRVLDIFNVPRHFMEIMEVSTQLANTDEIKTLTDQLKEIVKSPGFEQSVKMCEHPALYVTDMYDNGAPVCDGDRNNNVNIFNISPKRKPKRLANPRHELTTASKSVSSDQKGHSLVVCGSDIGDIPTSYSITGVASHEFPVIGTYIDKRILKGFRYRVRELDKKRFLFNGRALPLLSIGMGYGKRITFQGDSCRRNKNYFWSDSCASGYAFCLESIAPGDKFVIHDAQGVNIGVANILEIMGQWELKTRVLDGSVVEKVVEVVFMCSVLYITGRDGLVSMNSGKTVKLSGLVTLRRDTGHSEAKVVSIKALKLPHTDRNCTFLPNLKAAL